MSSISITGARANNLKRIDVDIPMGKVVVVTGISGSGKSSLVFNIIFEHGRKQYLESIGMMSAIQDEDLFAWACGAQCAVGPAMRASP